MAFVDLGTVRPGTTLYIPFHAFDSNDPSASTTISGLATTDIEIYKDGSVTQRASDNGYTLLDTDGIDFDGLTGINGLSINLADNSTAGFYAAGSQYWVVIASITVDAATVNFILATFRIGYEDAVLNTTIATLASQTSFTLTSGPAEDDALNGCIVCIHDVASAVQLGFAVVQDYTGATKTVTLTAGTTFTAAATDNISFFPPSNAQYGGTVAYTATRGLAGTALPAVAAEAAGGLYTRGTGAGQINQPANGLIDVNVENWNTTAVPAEHTAGYPIVTIKDGTGTGEINTNGGAIALVDLVTTTTTVTNQLTAAQIATGVWQDSTAGDFTVASSIGKALYIANIAPGASGGHFISGSNAGTTTVGAWTVTGATTHTGNVSMAAGLNITQSSANTSALVVTGNGTGHGAVITSGSGATGHGVQMVAASTNGNGLEISGSGAAAGLDVIGGATGAGAIFGSSGDGNGITIQSAGTGSGVVISGGATAGVGLLINTTSGDAVQLTPTAGDGIQITGQGSGNHGMRIVGGSGTGVGISVDDITTTSTVTFNALTVSNATTLTGAVSFGSTWGVTGAVTFSGGLTSDITGNITGNLSGSVGSVTGNVGGNVTGTIGSLAAQAKADVNAEVLDVIATDTLIDGRTIQSAIRIVGAAVAGRISGAGTGTETFLGFDEATTRIVITVDSSGNRTDITYS